ncbi:MULTISPECIES: hypothetical protein [Haloarcula]|uniref:PH domain-containing protein n=1 Tax=Haloarcula pellucida TaxID=1427151 RepID=A0A830GMM6_9EURY|nr:MULTISPECIES: hypothetical protein [Halomicroarcula]MBX0348216.1 hypothetical protein [Halomicroarcula pellucida]MDS0278070.1 hypothetical protein [Halomicroarcula sp. S1AR25-4]GGN97534.1 hypothetical protein GCM10009030_26860 [Halomicroarcula pellucida]
MSPSTDSDAPRRDADPLFGVVSGAYLALLCVPPVVLVVSRLVTGSPAALYGTALVTFAAVTGAGWLGIARWDGLAVRLGRTAVRWLPAVVPVGYALGGFASLGQTGVVGVLAFFFGLVAMLFGFALGVMARTRYADAVTADATTDCEFTAGWPERARRRLLVVAGSLVTVTAVGFVAGLLTDRFWLQLASQVLFPVGLVLVTGSEERTYTVSEAGLEHRLPVARRLFPWSAFDGYTRTDDALVLHRSWRVDTRIALADLSDPDAVDAAFARYLG